MDKLQPIWRIYTLSDYRGNIFYVGKTKRGLQARLYGHIQRLKTDNISIEQLDGTGHSVIACQLETYWIQQLRAWGFILKNKNQMPGKQPHPTINRSPGKTRAALLAKISEGSHIKIKGPRGRPRKAV